MTRKRLWTSAWCGAASLLLLGSTGCQTYIGGMTLPSAYYLKQKPSYIQPASQFPLPRELAQQQAAYAASNMSVNGAAPAAGGGSDAPPAPNVPAPAMQGPAGGPPAIQPPR